MVRIKTPNVGSVRIPKPRAFSGGATRFNWKVRINLTKRGGRIEDHMAKWRRSFLFRGAASLRTWVIRNFKRRTRKKRVEINGREYTDFIHSPAGSAPYAHLRKSKFLRVAIQFAVDLPGRIALVGTSWRKAKRWGQMHEFGGLYKENHPGRDGTARPWAFFHKRPFLKPVGVKWAASSQKTSLKGIARSTKMWAYK